MAPSNDSSASRSWGGTRAPLGDGGGGRPQRTGAGVVKGLDHGSPTLPVGVWGT